MEIKNILIGIDPGTTTGVAIWNRRDKIFDYIGSGTIIDVFDIVESAQIATQWKGCCELWFEDARQRTWYGTCGREKLQGVGSIKRDCNIWEEYCINRNIPFRMVAPRHIRTKTTAETFYRLTGWKRMTNKHARDAGMICFQG